MGANYLREFNPAIHHHHSKFWAFAGELGSYCNKYK